MRATMSHDTLTDRARRALASVPGAVCLRVVSAMRYIRDIREGADENRRVNGPVAEAAWLAERREFVQQRVEVLGKFRALAAAKGMTDAVALVDEVLAYAQEGQ
jgi:hypothetical protein